MAKRYRPVERDQQFLLPEDMRAWLPADHPVWLLIEIVADHLDTAVLHRQRRLGGAGRAGYDPEMLFTLLVWAWARGVRSSRRIERLCQEDVSFRVICAGDGPDHVTVHRFRAGLSEVVEELFAQVLRVCARLGMGRLDTIALDGTKIAANASTSANRTADGLRKLAAQIVAEHAATDTAEDTLFGDRRGDEVPPDPPGSAGPGQAPRSRAERIAAALADLQAEEQAARAEQQARRAKAAADPRVNPDAEGPTPTGRVSEDAAVAAAELALARAIVDQQAKIDAYPARAAAARATRRSGVLKPPLPVEQHHRVRRAHTRLNKARARHAARQQQHNNQQRKPVRNLTDPDSRLMPVRGGGWIQGYNCQAVPTADNLILATDVSNNPADVIAFQPMMRAAQHNADIIQKARPEPPPPTTSTSNNTGIELLLADAGYYSEDNLTAAGPDRLIALGKARDLTRAARQQPTHGPPPAEATPTQAMDHRLRTPQGTTAYHQRGHIAETPFGHAKHNWSFRQFSGRGLTNARTEWAFHALVHNLFKAITNRLAALPS